MAYFSFCFNSEIFLVARLNPWRHKPTICRLDPESGRCCPPRPGGEASSPSWKLHGPQCSKVQSRGCCAWHCPQLSKRVAPSLCLLCLLCRECRLLGLLCQECCLLGRECLLLHLLCLLCRLLEGLLCQGCRLLHLLGRLCLLGGLLCRLGGLLCLLGGLLYRLLHLFGLLPLSLLPQLRWRRARWLPGAGAGAGHGGRGRGRNVILWSAWCLQVHIPRMRSLCWFRPDTLSTRPRTRSTRRPGLWS